MILFFGLKKPRSNKYFKVPGYNPKVFVGEPKLHGTNH